MNRTWTSKEKEDNSKRHSSRYFYGESLLISTRALPSTMSPFLICGGANPGLPRAHRQAVPGLNQAQLLPKVSVIQQNPLKLLYGKKHNSLCLLYTVSRDSQTDRERLAWRQRRGEMLEKSVWKTMEKFVTWSGGRWRKGKMKVLQKYALQEMQSTATRDTILFTYLIIKMFLTANGEF